MSSVVQRVQKLQVAALFVLIVAGCTSAADNAASERSGVAADPTEVGEPRAAFSFRYEALGTKVLDCMLPNRSFAGSVFNSDTYVLVNDEGRVIRHVGGISYAGPGFFAAPLDNDWLAFADRDLTDAAEDLQLSIGVDLASHVGDRSPVDGNEIVRAALEEGSPIELLDEAGAGRDVWRLRSLPTTNGGPTLLLDVTIEGDDVARMIVREARIDGSPNSDIGWIVDYAPLPSRVDAPAAPPSSRRWTASMQLRPRLQRGCDLEVFRSPSPSP